MNRLYQLIKFSVNEDFVFENRINLFFQCTTRTSTAWFSWSLNSGQLWDGLIEIKGLKTKYHLQFLFQKTQVENTFIEMENRIWYEKENNLFAFFNHIAQPWWELTAFRLKTSRFLSNWWADHRWKDATMDVRKYR